MPPPLKESLAFCMLEEYYKTFIYFFNDFERQNFADKIFARKILTNLDCQIFINDSTVVEMGKKFDMFYLCYKHGVRVKNPFMQVNITDLNESSFFGEYQILLDIVSMYDYIACSDFRGREEEQPENTQLMTIEATKFTEICNEFPVFRSFLIQRGLQRRAFMKVKQRIIIDKL